MNFSHFLDHLLMDVSSMLMCKLIFMSLIVRKTVPVVIDLILKLLKKNENQTRIWRQIFIYHPPNTRSTTGLSRNLSGFI